MVVLAEPYVVLGTGSRINGIQAKNLNPCPGSLASLLPLLLSPLLPVTFLYFEFTILLVIEFPV